MAYVDVIMDGSGPHLDRFFTYRLPLERIDNPPLVGAYVKVPWGKTTRGGMIVASRNELPEGLEASAVKDFSAVTEEISLLTPSGWELLAWLRDFYFATWSSALQTVVPGPVLGGAKRGLRGRKRGAGASEAFPLLEPPEMTAAQRRVWEELVEMLPGGGTALLHGVTGSGKTEIYLRACQEVLSRGRGVLVLVPEVSLTPQAQARYRGRFGDKVSILHSGLGDADRREQWWRIRQGQTPLVVGTRSAIFAPLEDVGLVIVDEEHDASYKQSSDVRYHARQVAAWLARKHGGALLLGSATPCLETYSLAKEGRYRLLRLAERVHSQAMPTIKLVKGHGIPGLVLRALRERKERGEQSVILLNRRGFSRYLLCQECGWVPQCRDCSISMTFHKGARALRCHYCGASQPAPSVCGDCGGRHLDLPGKGTERVEADLLRALPELRVARLDRDTVGGKSSVFETTYNAFAAGELDCLLGTQMVSKGLDFPKVSLVVVLEADTGLHLPDFRAAERTFSLLTQVSGRAGRGDIHGEVMLVCQKPEHTLFADLLSDRWEEFMEGELALRRDLGYPPFRRMLRILVSDPSAERVEQVANELADAVEAANVDGRVELLGPASCPIEKLQGRYRWHLLLKASAVQDLQVVVRKALQTHDPRGARVSLDPDPLELL